MEIDVVRYIMSYELWTMRSIIASETGLSVSGLELIRGYQPSGSYCVQKIIERSQRMENCGFHAKDIHQVLVELYEVFDFCAVEEAAHYYENWQY